MVRLARRMYGEAGLAVAWSDFHGSPDVPLNETHSEFEFFTRWFEYDWLPEDGPGPGEALLESDDSSIDPEIRCLVETTLDSPYSFLQVIAMEPGVGFTARDILRKTDHRIIERTGSLTLERGSILYARVVEVDGITFMMGNGTRVIPSAFMADLVTLRQARRIRGLRGGWHPSLLVGLLVLAIRHGDRLALAMDARAFGSGPRSRFRTVRWLWWDLVLAIGAAVVLMVALALG